MKDDARLCVLKALEVAGGDFVSGAGLSHGLKVSRTSIWKHVRALQEQGYIIESRPHKGYRLISCPGTLSPLEIRKCLRAKVIGSEIQLISRVGSTQDECFNLAQKGAGEGLVVMAEEQFGGRGRVGRSFFSPKGGLWFSFVLRPPLHPQVCMPISLLAGVALSEAIRETTGLPAVLKWPNDILIRGRKAAGILTEIVAETDAVRFVVCGIGVNANVSEEKFPVELRPIATSLSSELGHEVSARELLVRILEKLDHYYLEMLSHGAKAILEAWRTNPNVLGSRIQVTSLNEKVEGTAVALDEDGALLVRTDDGLCRRVIAGDVVLKERQP